MAIKRSAVMFGAVGMLVAMAMGSRADIVAGLTPEQTAKLNAGDMVVSQRDVEGGVWPEVTVITEVAAPVATISQMFRDYEAAPSYQPGLISAKVVGEPSAGVVDVQYVSKLPLLGSTTYTVRNTFKQSGEGVSVNWKLLESSTADVSDGSLTVEPFDGKSLMRYTNYVKPKSAIAGIARGAALNEAKKTVAEIKAEAERRAKG